MNQRVDPKADASWQTIANSYRAALAFTECAGKRDAEAMREWIERPIGHSSETASMARLARKYRSCVGEAGAVAPLLIRAAVAETSLKLGRARTGVANPSPVGVPEVVAGYPLGRVARCQAGEAPEGVKRLLSTRPGSGAERKAAQALFASVPQCGTAAGLGRVQPTAARIALIEAALAAR